MFGFLIPDSNIWKYVNVLCKDKREKKKKGKYVKWPVLLGKLFLSICPQEKMRHYLKKKQQSCAMQDHLSAVENQNCPVLTHQ